MQSTLSSWVRINFDSMFPDEYADFASQNDIGEYPDFFWLKNAFIVDYIAEHLAENSYIHGTITTYDGYTRHLGGAGMAPVNGIFMTRPTDAESCGADGF